VKVVLSGDGGDELFGGYDTYVAQGMDRYYRWLPAGLRQNVFPTMASWVPPRAEKKGLVNKTKRFIEGAALSGDLQHTRWMMFMTPSDKNALYRPEVLAELQGDASAEVMQLYFQRAAKFNELAQQQYVDIKTYLVDNILTKVDRMSMAVSLEARVPLLDYRIVELAVNLPAHMKLHRGQTKRILRRAMADRLPEMVLNKPKQGFSIPLKNWLKDPLKPMMTDLLAQERIRQRGFFEPATVSRWVGDHLDGTENHSHRLWALMVFELWFQQVMDARTQAAAL
jgi:asparagine synthase (glutamine-hydrolysing)